MFNHHADETFGDWSRWAAQKYPGYEQLCGATNAGADVRFTAPQAWKTRLPEELYSTHYVAERSEEFIRRRAAKGDGKPFFLQCSFPDPHHPFTPPGRYWGMYSPQDVAAPPTCHEPGVGAPPHLRWIHEERRQGQSVLTSQRMFAVDEREAREMIALTYGMITMVDDAVGRILQALREAGLEDDTVVVFTSDHGDFMGDHGLMLKGPLHYQGLVRVPFIWADPAEKCAGARSAGLASSVDIARTVLARAGIAPVNGMQGRDIVGLQGRGDRATGPEAVLIEEDNQRAYLGFKEPVRARTLVTACHRITLYRGADWGEIYDLHDDPLEQENLWDRDPALRSRLLELLARKMMDSFDRSPRPTHVA
nr:sulfatase-like hydrolase/transferase [Ramlibacter sp. 2FC]